MAGGSAGSSPPPSSSAHFSAPASALPFTTFFPGPLDLVTIFAPLGAGQFGLQPRVRASRTTASATPTVVEVVVTLMGLMAMVSIPRTSCSKVTWDLRYLVGAARMFQVTTGSLPPALEELGSSKEFPSVMIPCDPWGHPYRYEVRNGSAVAKCLGRDGLVGGEREDADREWPAPRE